MKRALSILNDRFEELLSIAIFTIFILLMTLTVLFRFVLNFSLAWTEELSRYIFVFSVYIAAALAIKRQKHVRVEFVDMILPGKARKILSIILDVIWAVFTFAVGWNGIQIVRDNFQTGQLSPSLGIKLGWVYMIIPFCFFVMGLRIIQQICLKCKKGE